MDVIVVGAGSLGSLVGGLLAREHAVTLVGREAQVAAIEADGLTISGAIDATVHPSAAIEPPASADLALVTVKAYDTEDAARTLASTSLDAALSLQNGLGNEATLAANLDCPVLAGTCTYGARLLEPGHVECTGVGDVVLGPRAGGTLERADAVGVAFDRAGIDTTVAADMPQRLWEKLAVNAAINPITALARVPNGALADGPAATVAHQAARETARVARAHGIDLSDRDAVAATDRVVADTAANHSSMLQDVERERRTEIDAISGAVVERASSAAAADDDSGTQASGEDVGVAAPVNGTLAALVSAWEAQRNLR